MQTGVGNNKTLSIKSAGVIKNEQISWLQKRRTLTSEETDASWPNQPS